jgi:hypothetical protein
MPKRASSVCCFEAGLPRSVEYTRARQIAFLSGIIQETNEYEL